MIRVVHLMIAGVALAVSTVPALAFGNPAPIPEPATMSLLAVAGAAGAGVFAVRKLRSRK